MNNPPKKGKAKTQKIPKKRIHLKENKLIMYKRAVEAPEETWNINIVPFSTSSVNPPQHQKTRSGAFAASLENNMENSRLTNYISLL